VNNGHHRPLGSYLSNFVIGNKELLIHKYTTMKKQFYSAQGVTSITCNNNEEPLVASRSELMEAGSLVSISQGYGYFNWWLMILKTVL